MYDRLQYRVHPAITPSAYAGMLVTASNFHGRQSAITSRKGIPLEARAV